MAKLNFFTMRNFKLILSYDGTDFKGWQTQPGQRTVQETLRQMQRLSREELFETLPNPNRRKRLSKKVLGLA